MNETIMLASNMARAKDPLGHETEFSTKRHSQRRGETIKPA